MSNTTTVAQRRRIRRPRYRSKRPGLARSQPLTGRGASNFRVVFEAVSDALLHDNHAPDVTKLDQAIAKLRIAIDKAADNPLASHNAIVLPFVIDTLRRDLGDLIDARAAGSDLPASLLIVFHRNILARVVGHESGRYRADDGAGCDKNGDRVA